MTTVTLATHCHSRDLLRLHAPDMLEELVNSHNYPFDEILVIHQRCGDLPYEMSVKARVIDIHEQDYHSILGSFGIDDRDPALAEITHGWNWQWFFAHHCVNHCKEILEATSDYIVFCDADCKMVSQPEGKSWVEKGIELLETYSQIFMVCPSDGGHEFILTLKDGTRLVHNTSQQLFLANREKLLEMDFTDLRWNGSFDAPGGPMQEFYGMFEGHLWRWMRHKGDLYRAILPEVYRYFHGQWH